MRKIGCSIMDGMALAMLLPSSVPDHVDPDGVGKRGSATVRRGDVDTTDTDGVGRRGCATVRIGDADTTDEEGVGRSGRATVRRGGEWVIRGGRSARAVTGAVGSSAMSTDMSCAISCAIAEVGLNDGICEVRSFSGSVGCTRMRLLITFSHSLMGRSWLWRITRSCSPLFLLCWRS